MAVTINRYNRMFFHVGRAVINLEIDTFKLALMSAAHAFVDTHEVFSQVVANEISGNFGYVSGGQDLSNVTWQEVGGVATWNADDVTWNAVGGSIAAAHGVIYDDTPTVPQDPVMFSINFDGLQTANDGTPFVVAWNVAGIFEV